MSKEAMKLALEALSQMAPLNSIEAIEFDNKRNKAITALREALAEQPAQQQPVTTTCCDSFLSGYGAAQADAKVCDLPPHGWHCTRNAGHEGPCAAVKTDDHELVAHAMKRMAEQPAQQEPAGWRPATFHRDNLTFNPGLPDEQTVKFWKLQGVEIEYCYTSPPAQRTWVGLTAEEIDTIYREIPPPVEHWKLSRAIEAKLKEKNNGN